MFACNFVKGLIFTPFVLLKNNLNEVVTETKCSNIYLIAVKTKKHSEMTLLAIKFTDICYFSQICPLLTS